MTYAAVGSTGLGFVSCWPKCEEEELEAINTYITGMIAEVSNNHATGRITGKQWKLWQEQLSEWRPFYKTVTGSMYVSASDLSAAKAKRDAIQMNLDAAGKLWVLAHAHDAGEAKEYEDQPTPWWKWALWGTAGFAMIYLLGSVAIKSGIGAVATRHAAPQTPNRGRRRNRRRTANRRAGKLPSLAPRS